MVDMNDTRCFTCKHVLHIENQNPCKECEGFSEWKEIKSKRLLNKKMKLNDALVEYLDAEIKALSETDKKLIWNNCPNINDIEDLIELGLYTRKEAEAKIFKNYLIKNFLRYAVY